MNVPRVTASLAAVPAQPNEHWPVLSVLPTTQLRILVDLALAVFYVVGCLVADMISRPIGQGTQITIGTFIASMLGIGAVQWVQKRRTTFPSSTSVTTDASGTTTATATQGTAEPESGLPAAGGVTLQAPTPDPTNLVRVEQISAVNARDRARGERAEQGERGEP